MVADQWIDKHFSNRSTLRRAWIYLKLYTTFQISVLVFCRPANRRVWYLKDCKHIPNSQYCRSWAPGSLAEVAVADALSDFIDRYVWIGNGRESVPTDLSLWSADFNFEFGILGLQVMTHSSGLDEFEIHGFFGAGNKRLKMPFRHRNRRSRIRVWRCAMDVVVSRVHENVSWMRLESTPGVLRRILTYGWFVTSDWDS